MKFNDAYRSANDHVHVRESLRNEIEQKLAQETAPKPRETRRRWFVAIPTAVAAAAAVFVAVVVGVRFGGSKSSAPMAVSDQYEASAEEAVQEPMITIPRDAAATAGEQLRTAESYQELAKLLQERGQRSFYGISSNRGMIPADASIMPEPVDMPAEEPAAAPETEAFETDMKGTGTNVQVEGVDEADLVKTDGEFLYVLRSDSEKLDILSANGKDTELLSSLELKKQSDDHWFSEMMLANDKLFVIGNLYDWNQENPADMYSTVIDVYALGDRKTVSKISTLKQAGSYKTARLIGDTLAVVSVYNAYEVIINDGIDIPIGIPSVYRNGERSLLEPGRIYVDPVSDKNSFTVITTVDTKDGADYLSERALLGGSDTVYCSDTTLLITSSEHEENETEELTDETGAHYVKRTSKIYTGVCAFALRDGAFEPLGTAKIDGTLLNQFSIDAYGSTYRFVTARSIYETTIFTDGIDRYEYQTRMDCALYVLDEQLAPLGAVEGLSENETVQSVRFLGDTVYFVTFRNTDPLFAVDLSDPGSPKILSELKITGFSAYLHPFGEGRLLGIGYEADAETGWTTGVKISLYDISDPSNVSELFRKSISADYTTVQYNHKAVFADAASGIAAFPADNCYYVCRISDSGAELLGTVETGEMGWSGNARGVAVGDAFYVVTSDAVTVLSFETMEKLATIALG